MTISELDQTFRRNTVPHRYYSFEGAGGGDCYALELIHGEWTLSYYDQRGTRRNAQSYPDESTACQAMFAAIKDMVEGQTGKIITLV